MNSNYSYINKIEQRMSDDAKDMLRRIWEPTVICASLSDARRDICILPDGEIRAYGHLYGKAHGDGVSAYLSSIDGGISWTKHYARGKMNSCTYIEEANIYLTVAQQHKEGLWIMRSKIGPDDPAPEEFKIANGIFICDFLPQKSDFSNRIWFTTQRLDCLGLDNERAVPFFVYSDDFGKSWTTVELAETPPFEIKYPHKGLRWCIASGAEPYAVELSNEKMMMIIRSPHDCFYKSYSYDGGSSWSTPEPSTFYGTNTTPFMLRLSDGRIVTLWNNTKPLPQPDHDKTYPPVSKWVKLGKNENAFTNRDAAHAAISLDGGESFVGYREILLNHIRGNTDFRYIGGTSLSLDKSVHQFQAYELPFGKILVCAGQNISNRMLIFDINWLFETEAHENFVQNALEKITTHTYVKSFCDHTAEIAGNGHCAWNRAPGSYLLPDPDGSYCEVLNIRNHHDDRLYNDIGGATWNFPASDKGCVNIEMKIAEKSARIILSDRWYNTCDPYAAEFSPFSFEISADEVGTGYNNVSIKYDTRSEEASLYVNDKLLLTKKAEHRAPTGLSYLIMQCVTDGESEGFYVKSMSKK